MHHIAVCVRVPVCVCVFAYIVFNSGIGLFLQQQRHQSVTLLLGQVMQACVSFLS